MDMGKNKFRGALFLSAVLFVQFLNPVVAMEDEESFSVDLDALSSVAAAPTTVLEAPRSQELQPVKQTDPINVDNGGRWRTHFSISVGDARAANESFPLLSGASFKDERLTEMTVLEEFSVFNPNKVHFDMALDVREFISQQNCSESNVTAGALTFVFSIGGEKKTYTIPLKSEDSKLLFFVSGHNSGAQLLGEMRGEAYTSYKYPKDKSNNAHYLALLGHLIKIFSPSSPDTGLYKELEEEISKNLEKCFPLVAESVRKESEVLKDLSGKIASLGPIEVKQGEMGMSPENVTKKLAELADLSQQLKVALLSIQETLPKTQKPLAGLSQQITDLLSFLDSEEYLMQHLHYGITRILDKACDEVSQLSEGKDVKMLGVITHIHTFLDLCPHCSAMLTKEILSDAGLGGIVRKTMIEKYSQPNPFFSILVSSQEDMKTPTSVGSPKGVVFYSLLNRRVHGIDTEFLSEKPLTSDNLIDISRSGRFLQTMVPGEMLVKLSSGEYQLFYPGHMRPRGTIVDSSYKEIVGKNAIIMPNSEHLLKSPHELSGMIEQKH